MVDRRPGSPWWMKVWAHRLPAERVERARREYAAAPRGGYLVRGDQAADVMEAVARMSARFPEGRVRVRPWQDQLGRQRAHQAEGWL